MDNTIEAIEKCKYEFYIKNGVQPNEILMSKDAYNKLAAKADKVIMRSRSWKYTTCCGIKIVFDETIEGYKLRYKSYGGLEIC